MTGNEPAPHSPNTHGITVRKPDYKPKTFKQIPLPGFRTKAEGKGQRHTKPKRKR